MSYWIEENSKHDTKHRYWKRAGYIGGNMLICNTHQIMFGHKISGSGLGAFGEIKDWPYADLEVEFPEGCDELAIKFINEVQIFVDKFCDENGLEIPENCKERLCLKCE